jgi:hypothetical protein
MTFNNVGPVNAGVFNQIAGTQYNTGGQNVAFAPIQGARDASADLRRVLTPVPGHNKAAAEILAQLDELDAGLLRPEPEKGRVARALERLTRILMAIGARGAALIRPLTFLAQWLGPLGGPILQLLPHVA